MIEVKAADTEAQIYTFLNPDYKDDPDLPFTPGPDLHLKLTAQEFNQDMFQEVKTGLQSQQQLTQYKAVVTMREIVGISDLRKVTFIEEYMPENLVDYCFRQMQCDSPAIVRYEVLHILKILADDLDLYQHLITQKKCIEVFLKFLGKERHTLIRNKAKQVLRGIIAQDIQAKKTNIFNSSFIEDLIEKLKNVEKKAQAREIVMIILKIYDNFFPKKELVPQICSIFYETIKSNLFQQDESTGSELACVLQGLSNVYKRLEDCMVPCEEKYKIKDQLMNYARLSENLSRPAMLALRAFTDEQLVEKDDFFNLAQELLDKQEKEWSTLPELYRALLTMSQTSPKTFLPKQQLLKSLPRLILQNKDLFNNKEPLQNKESLENKKPLKNKPLSHKQQQKNKEKEKLNFIVQMAISTGGIYQRMIHNAQKKNQKKIILELILSQNILAVIVIAFQEKYSTEDYIAGGLQIIEDIGSFMKQQKIAKQAVRQLLNQVNILRFLKKFQESNIDDISSQAKSIYDSYFGKFSDVSRLSNEDSSEIHDDQEEEEDDQDEYDDQDDDKGGSKPI